MTTLRDLLMEATDASRGGAMALADVIEHITRAYIAGAMNMMTSPLAPLLQGEGKYESRIPKTSPLRALYRDWEKRLVKATLAEWQGKAKKLATRLKRDVPASRKSINSIFDDDAFWEDWENDYLILLAKYMAEAAEIGARAGLEDSGVGVDWKLVNTRARDWGKEYAAQMVKLNRRGYPSLTDVDKQRVRDALGTWIESAETFKDLADRLTEVVGNEERAALIGATESTRAYAAGTTIGWEEAGLINKGGMDEAQAMFPQHPGCRCWPTLDPGRGIIFRTAEDELVCPICGALANTVIVRLGD